MSSKKEVNINISFGSYFGISVPQLLISSIDLRLFKSCVKLLNNELDSFRLKNLELEFNIFKYAMNNIVIRDYTEPNIKRLSRKVKKSKEYYDKVNNSDDLDENIEKPLGLLSEEDLKIQEETLSKCEKTPQDYVIIDGKTIKLSKEATEIIKVLDSYSNDLDTLKDSIEIKDFTEVRFMGVPFSTYIKNRPGAIKYKYLDGVYKHGNQERMRGRACEEIETFMDLITSKIDKKDYTNIDVVNGKAVNVGYKVSDADITLLTTLKENGILKRLTTVEVKNLVRLYQLSRMFTVDFYNSFFELNLTQEEYEKVFRELEDIGIIGLGFYSDKLFLDCIRKYNISEYTRTVISENDELAKNIKLVYRAAHSRLEFGGELDEG